MQEILKFWPMILGAFAVVVAWTRLNTQVKAQRAFVNDLKGSMMKSFESLEKKIDRDISGCKAEHSICREAATVHIQEHEWMHSSKEERRLLQEWRSNVTQELNEIKGMVQSLVRSRP